MSEYKQSNVAGIKWQRASRVVLENQLEQIPSANFIEEEVISFDAEKISRPVGNLVVPMSDPLYEFPIRDFQTNEIIPDQKATYGDIFTLLFSAYWDAAEKRDR